MSGRNRRFEDSQTDCQRQSEGEKSSNLETVTRSESLPEVAEALRVVPLDGLLAQSGCAEAFCDTQRSGPSTFWAQGFVHLFYGRHEPVPANGRDSSLLSQASAFFSARLVSFANRCAEFFRTHGLGPSYRTEVQTFLPKSLLCLSSCLFSLLDRHRSSATFTKVAEFLCRKGSLASGFAIVPRWFESTEARNPLLLSQVRSGLPKDLLDDLVPEVIGSELADGPTEKSVFSALLFPSPAHCPLSDVREAALDVEETVNGLPDVLLAVQDARVDVDAEPAVLGIAGRGHLPAPRVDTAPKGVQDGHRLLRFLEVGHAARTPWNVAGSKFLAHGVAHA